METVTSRDGSVIGFESFGQGPPMVLVHGTSAGRGRWAPVLETLAGRFRVHVLDRRGRGLSTAEGGPYAIAREGEDIAAVVEAVGRDVFVLAHSYGALCSLEAALITGAIGRMVLYEPPASTPGHRVAGDETLERLRAAGDDPEAVLETFFHEVIGLSHAEIEAMRDTPIWPVRLAAAPTVLRELETADRFAVTDRLAKIGVPVRLLVGTESLDYFRPAAEAVAAMITGAELADLPGQDHVAIDRDPELFVTTALAP